MKNIIKILITFLLSFSLSYSADNNEDPLSALNNTYAELDLNNMLVDANDTMKDNNSTEILDIVEDANTTENNSTEVVFELSEFEKLFVNHSAHIYYSKAVKDLYESNYKSAYDNAMKAQVIYDNTNNEVEQIIPLPYMPSFMRESAYTAKRIYYKMVKPKPYELKRLVTKAKLISPPIATVALKKTSTYIDVIIKNYGDLPLDGFEVLLNDEPIAKYEKILPNEEKVTRLEASPSLYEISFKEKYGFAPNSIMLSEDE